MIVHCTFTGDTIKISLKEENQLFSVSLYDNNMLNFMIKGTEILQQNIQRKLDDEVVIEYYHVAMKRMEKLLVYATEQYEISIRHFEKISFDAQNKSVN